MASKKKAPAPVRRYWLFKSEPEVYSIDDLARDRRCMWEGVRNYQARNLLRDEVAVGDGVLFYHSSTDPLAVAGIAKVVRAGYPDPTAFDPKARYHDPDSDPGDPRWYTVDIALVKKLPEPVARARLQAEPALRDMVLLRRGSRLSIQPVTSDEWRAVLGLAGVSVEW
jgi:predicted RNA-binding protein with PUA-like domain